MTKEEILARLREIEAERCFPGMQVQQYMRGVVDAVFEVTAEVLAQKNAANSQ